MEQIKESHGCFNLSFRFANEPGYLSIHPQMYSVKQGVSPTGAYFVYCMHPVHGSCTFVVEQNENGIWASERHPPFVSKAFIQEIGREIEKV
jgi:hypothetical protein